MTRATGALLSSASRIPRAAPKATRSTSFGAAVTIGVPAGRVPSRVPVEVEEATAFRAVIVQVAASPQSKQSMSVRTPSAVKQEREIASEDAGWSF